jgi:hypothetical protein
MTKEYQNIKINIIVPPAFQERVHEWINQFTRTALAYHSEPKMISDTFQVSAEDLPNFISLNDCGTELEQAWFHRSATRALSEAKQDFLLEVISDSRFGKFRSRAAMPSTQLTQTK